MKKNTLLTVAVTITVLALLILPTAALAAKSTHFNNKYTFEDVTFSDGTTGVIEAASKQVDDSTFTTCSYYSDNYAQYLGQYQSDTFASADANEVEQFCLDNYVNRQ